MCPLAAISSYLHVRGEAPGPLFPFRDGRPLSRPILASKVQHILHSAGYPGTLGTVFELVQPPLQPHVEYPIISSKPWAAGPVMCIKSTSEPLSYRLCRLPASYYSRRYVTGNWTVGCLRFSLGCGAVAFLPRALLLRVALAGSLRLGRGLVAGLSILLATGVVPSCRGWVARQL